MNDIIDLIGSSKYDFVGPLAFGAIMFVGILIGFWNGFKTALYFLVLNIFCITGSILVFYFGPDLAKAVVPSDLEVKSKNILALAKAGNKGVINIIALLGSLIIFVGLNLVIFLPLYFAFRKTLKATMFDNKVIKVSNLSHRLGGGALGLLISFPVALLTATLLTPLGSESSGFVSVISSVSEIYVIKQAENIPESIFALAKTLTQ